MGYVGSYVWGVRQKAGDLRLITATADVVPIDPTGNEVSETRWFTIEEAEALKKTSWSDYVIPALKTYLATGEFQQIVMVGDQKESQV